MISRASWGHCYSGECSLESVTQASQGRNYVALLSDDPLHNPMSDSIREENAQTWCYTGAIRESSNTKTQ